MSEGFVIWLTGLSGAGKSTIAQLLQGELETRGRHSEVLDGDEVRTNLSKGLGFSKKDRDTNVRRIGYVAGLVARSGGVVIAAAISPYREIRDEIRAKTPGFFEVYVRCPLDELVRRDVKGLYKQAIAGEIANFTGISDPYEEPLTPAVTVDSSELNPVQAVSRILTGLERAGHLEAASTDRLPQGPALKAAIEEAQRLPAIEVGPRELSDLYLLAAGGFAPLSGFVDSDDYHHILDQGRLASGAPFTIPVALRAASAPTADRLTLRLEGQPVGIIEVTEVFSTDPEKEALKVYGTLESAHPGVALLQQEGRYAIAGAVTALATPTAGFPQYERTPAEVRRIKIERGWRTMVGFQTRNPVHRAHEHLQKVALELVDGLLLHPLVGETKADDIPAKVRMRCYEALLEGYYPQDRTLLSTNPAWMRYAGPKEAVFHALLRRNFGCTHFIVGRDHAGVGNYYGTYAAHKAFDAYQPGELGIEILRFENAFFCRTCGAMASVRTCPHGEEDRVSLSGSKVRELLRTGGELPPEFSRPEVARVLQAAAAGAAS